MSDPLSRRPQVGLFVTCLIDLMRPSVGFAAVKLLELAQCDVVVPTQQTCCGQPAHNSGDTKLTAAIARNTIAALEGYDYVVVPSGSCAGMLKHHYPVLLANDSAWASRAFAFGERVHELTAFLVDIRGLETTGAQLEASVTFHDSCAGLREMGLSAQPRKLLSNAPGVTLVEMSDPEVCCGFGGTFAEKYPAISGAIADRKCQSACATGADLLVACDLGCLLHLAGKLKRDGAALGVRHIAEVLADELSAPPIGEA